MAVNFPTIADLTTRTRSGVAFTGVATNAFTLATRGGTSLLGPAPGLTNQRTVPVNIGRCRRVIPIGTFST